MKLIPESDAESELLDNSMQVIMMFYHDPSESFVTQFAPRFMHSFEEEDALEIASRICAMIASSFVINFNLHRNLTINSEQFLAEFCDEIREAIATLNDPKYFKG